MGLISHPGSTSRNTQKTHNFSLALYSPQQLLFSVKELRDDSSAAAALHPSQSLASTCRYENELSTLNRTLREEASLPSKSTRA